VCWAIAGFILIKVNLRLQETVGSTVLRTKVLGEGKRKLGWTNKSLVSCVLTNFFSAARGKIQINKEKEGK